MSQDPNPRLWKNGNRAYRGKVDLRFRIGDSGGLGEAIPRGIVASDGAFVEEALSQPEQVGNPQRIPLSNWALYHLLEVVYQQFGPTVVAIAHLRQFAGRAGDCVQEPEHHPKALDERRCRRSRAFGAHQQQRRRKKLRDQYLVTGRSLVIPTVFVYLFCHFGFDSLPVFAAPRRHALAVEEHRKAVKPHDVTQVVIASQ